MGPALAPAETVLPCLDDLLAVAQKHGQTERMLPVALHHMLHAVVAIFELPSSIERNLLMLVLPKLVWNSSFRQNNNLRGHQRRQHIEKRFVRALKGQWTELVHAFLHECPNAVYPVHENGEIQQGRLLQRAAQKGSTAKAWRILNSHGLAKDRDQAWEEVQAKPQPHGHEQAAYLPLDEQLLENPLTIDDFQKRILRLESNKAMDAYGWSHESMQSLWASKQLRESLREWSISFMVCTLHSKTRCWACFMGTPP